MLKSKSQETHWVCFSCIKTFYPPAAYSPLNRSMVSNWFKTLLFDALHLRILSNRALVSIACRFNSDVNKFLTNYYAFTSINTNSINTPDNFNFSSITLAPSVVEDIYMTTVTKDVDMTDVSPLLCQWSLLMITDRLYCPLPTHLKWTSGISSCNPWALHQLDPLTKQQLCQMLRMISTFFGWSHLVTKQDPLRFGMSFSWTHPPMRYLFSTNVC